MPKKRAKADKHQLHCEIPKELFDRLDGLATDTARSVTSHVREALETYLTRREENVRRSAAT